MKINEDLLKQILTVFYQSDKAHLYLQDLQSAGIKTDAEDDVIDQTFLFHMQILLENRWLSDDNFNSSLNAIGIELITDDGRYRKLGYRIRITGAGINYLETPEPADYSEGY